MRLLKQATSIRSRGAVCAATIAGAALLLFEADVRAAWTTGWSVQVMDVQQGSALVYDFSTVFLGPEPGTGVPKYAAVFHAEPFVGDDGAKPNGGGCHGDSVAIRYSTSAFGVNVFGLHSAQQDMLITRAKDTPASRSEYLSSSQCLSDAEPYPSYSGAANPTLIYAGAEGPWWAIYYLSGRSEEGTFRNYLMPALVSGTSLFNLRGSTMYYLDRAGSDPPYCNNTGLTNSICYAGNTWTPMSAVGSSAALQYREILTARPAHQAPLSFSAEKRLRSGNKDGLLGSFSYDHTNSVLYWYYVNKDPDGFWRLHRRTATTGVVTQFSTEDDGGFTPKLLGTDSPLVRVNYHATAQKWVVLYSCYTRETRTGVNPNTGLPETKAVQDICMQTFPQTDANLTGFTWAAYDGDPNGANLGIGIPRDPCIGPGPAPDYGCAAGGRTTFSSSLPFWISQFNIRKDGYGHHFHDGTSDIIVYFSAQYNALPGLGNPYYQYVYAKQVNAQ